VVALVPPNHGIRATLATSGVSRVTISGDVFQDVVVRRDPELVALTSPTNATGLFDLDTQSDMLLPFEGIGVDTSWEFQMPRASNPFDFRTISDVLITIEYTALHSFDYRQQLIQRLDRSIDADRVLSLKQAFPDQWYELLNADQSATPMTIRFATTRDDFPPNLDDDLQLRNLALYFIPATDAAGEIRPRAALRLRAGNTVLGQGDATAIDGLVSTRRGWNWAPRNTKPFGEWELSLTDAQDGSAGNNVQIRDLLSAGKVADIIFVISYSGTVPAWPV
jgi:hypothetical protein